MDITAPAVGSYYNSLALGGTAGSWGRKTRDPRHRGYAAPSRRLRLGRRKTPQGALVMTGMAFG